MSIRLICLVLFYLALTQLVSAGGKDNASQPGKDTALNSEGEISFQHALFNRPLELNYRTDQVLSEAVTDFHRTGVNIYSGNAESIGSGKKLYQKQCQACHLKDGTGRIGPNLTDDIWLRDRTNTEVGRFEIIYGGGAGAMQAFGQRIDQDDILKIMAYIDTFRQ